MVIAATHKSWAYKNLEVPTKTVTKRGKEKEEYDLYACPDYIDIPTDHEVDAVNLARYAYEKIKEEKESHDD